MPFLAPVAAALGGWGATASLAMGAAGIMQGQEAASQSKKAGRARAKIARLENFRTAVNTVREARIKRAQVVAGAEASGMAPDSSAVLGGLGSLESQLYGNLDYIAKSWKLNSVANAAEIRASQATSDQYAFNAAADLFGKIPDIFKNIPTPVVDIPIDATAPITPTNSTGGNA